MIHVKPLPTVDLFLADLGSASVFSSMNFAVCTQPGTYEWNVTSVGLASSPGWFKSIVVRVCEGLDRFRLFIHDIVSLSENGEDMYRTWPDILRAPYQI